jgi:DNA-binding NtrC family response regulator
VLAPGDTVRLEDLGEHAARSARGLPPALPAPRPAADVRAAPASAGSVTIPIGCSLAEAERRIVLANLRHFGTRARAAEALGVGLRTLYTKLAAWSRDGKDGAETA